MISASNILKEFKNSDKNLHIADDDRSYDRFRFQNDFTLFIDYYKKNDLGAELRDIKFLNKDLVHLLNSKDKLEAYSEAICERITYLSERFKLIEIDAQNNKAQVRSYPPYITDTKKMFFEIIVDAIEGSLMVQRKMSDTATQVTGNISFILNDELLERVLDDIITPA